MEDHMSARTAGVAHHQLRGDTQPGDARRTREQAPGSRPDVSARQVTAAVHSAKDGEHMLTTNADYRPERRPYQLSGDTQSGHRPDVDARFVAAAVHRTNHGAPVLTMNAEHRPEIRPHGYTYQESYPSYQPQPSYSSHTTSHSSFSVSSSVNTGCSIPGIIVSALFATAAVALCVLGFMLTAPEILIAGVFVGFVSLGILLLASQ